MLAVIYGVMFLSLKRQVETDMRGAETDREKKRDKGRE